MKKFLILLVCIAFVFSMAFVGIGCKTEIGEFGDFEEVEETQAEVEEVVDWPSPQKMSQRIE